MTVLAPPRIGGLMMGVWFLATSVGNFIGGRVSGLYESFRCRRCSAPSRALRSSPASLLMIASPSMRKLMPAPGGRSAAAVEP